MDVQDLSATEWALRQAVFDHFAATGHAPDLGTLATSLEQPLETIHRGLYRLHRRHLLYYEGHRGQVRMANPFSGVPTPFRAQVDGVEYIANCAWDLLGIPAALNRDATLVGRNAATGEALHFEVVDGVLSGDDVVTHFPLPVKRWYDDLVFT